MFGAVIHAPEGKRDQRLSYLQMLLLENFPLFDLFGRDRLAAPAADQPYIFIIQQRTAEGTPVQFLTPLLHAFEVSKSRGVSTNLAAACSSKCHCGINYS
jgi:hypothetical protein